jgi:Domain of unknown function DUF11
MTSSNAAARFVGSSRQKLLLTVALLTTLGFIGVLTISPARGLGSHRLSADRLRRNAGQELGCDAALEKSERNGTSNRGSDPHRSGDALNREESDAFEVTTTIDECGPIPTMAPTTVAEPTTTLAPETTTTAAATTTTEPPTTITESPTATTTAATSTTTTASPTTTTTGAPVPTPVLELTLNGPAGAFPGQEIDYVFTVTNTGQGASTGVQLVATLPTTGSFVSTIPGASSVPQPGVPFVIDVPDLAALASTQVSVRWKSPSELVSITIRAEVVSANATTSNVVTATTSVGVSNFCIQCDVTAAGTGLRNRNQGFISITDVPTGATVLRAVLVWNLLYNDATPPPNTITFDGTVVSADVTADESTTLCWGDTASVGYAADVTQLVQGNGTYAVTNPPVRTIRVDASPATNTPAADGASLIVFYTSPGSNNQVFADFHYDTDTDIDQRFHRSFAGITSTGGASTLILVAADGQNSASELLTLTGAGTIALNDTLDGSDPQIGPSFGQGNLWDTDTHDVTRILPAGQTTFSLDHIKTTSDCLGLGAVVLKVAQ